MNDTEDLINKLSKLKIEYELLYEEFKELENIYFQIEEKDYEIALIIRKLETKFLEKEKLRLLEEKNKLEKYMRDVYGGK
ncbi:MAG: hypothetical protein IJX99_09045 [Clostridia bacterium]|nr:hypothetical protein [Clostridia bacterium]